MQFFKKMPMLAATCLALAASASTAATYNTYFSGLISSMALANRYRSPRSTLMATALPMDQAACLRRRRRSGFRTK
jgi:hypothetical protein